MGILKVKNLKTYFYLDNEEVRAVDGVDFEVKKGEIVAIVGESGSGKSVTALSIMGLVREPGKIVNGEIKFHDNNLVGKKEKELRLLRGSSISMVYQSPMTSLNPMLKVGYQIAEALIIHQNMRKKEAREKAIEIMEIVGIADARLRYNDYPKSFSGGMRQRIMIATSIACNPEILIADEPTTALDVTIQAEVLKLLKDLRDKLGMSIILITHDLGVVAGMADRVLIMYCGKIVEVSKTSEIFKNPLNPYTKGLMKCIPGSTKRKEALYTIKGSVPHPTDFPAGCRFSNRCDNVIDICHKKMPDMINVGSDHAVRCWHFSGDRSEIS